MADLSTTYMGVKLKNPLILGACNLVTKPETIKQIENRWGKYIQQWKYKTM